MTSEINQAYLMWIGKEHYGDIAEWTEEAVTMGVSKRLPNLAMGEALMAPGTVIFVAHDEGESKPCPKCAGAIECPECRKRNAEIDRTEEQKGELVSHHAATLKAVQAEIMTKVASLDKRIERLEAENAGCATCGGEGVAVNGTGGIIVVMGDSGKTERWDYRRYNYWLHQPAKWTPKDVVSVDMCRHCGGTGRLPEGKVFGLFVPSAIEYILPEGATDELKAEVEARKFKTVAPVGALVERKRKCGYRKPGGVYVVTATTDEAAVEARAIVEELVKSGRISAEGVEIVGGLVKFLSPIPIESKRFRGLKRWNLDPRAEEEAEMILDAMG
jgi:hypothetical protein